MCEPEHYKKPNILLYNYLCHIEHTARLVVCIQTWNEWGVEVGARRGCGTTCPVCRLTLVPGFYPRFYPQFSPPVCAPLLIFVVV